MTNKRQTTIIGYWADDSTDKRIEQLIEHDGEWFNPSEDYYVMENPSERTLLILALMGVEIEFIKGAKTWHEYVKKIIEEQEKRARMRRNGANGGV